MARYAWVIDSVGIGEDLGDLLADDAGKIGPRDAPDALVSGLQRRDVPSRRFRIYDDDGVFYYAGRIAGEYSGFEPLDDFGEPNCGCTEIRYQDWVTGRGKFEAL
jgi:hypothetical protein